MRTSFDIFISCRMSGNDAQPTPDSRLAAVVFDYLVARNLHPFLAEKSLPGLGEPEYKKAIDEVLDGVPVLVVVGTSLENLESRWVKYEWDSFSNDILSGIKQGTILSYLSGIDPKSLPRTLRQHQAIQHTQGSLEVLFSYISNALGLRQVEETMAMLLSEDRNVIRSGWNRIPETDRSRFRNELLGRLGSGNAVDRRAAATALWAIRDRQAFTSIAQLLQDDAITVVIRALTLAAESRSRALIPVISSLRSHGNPAVRQAAREAYRQITGERA